MYCFIWGLSVLYYLNLFVMVLWYWILVYDEMLIWVVYLLSKKYYLISYCIFIKDVYCMIWKIGLNFLKIMDFNYKNFKSIVMYCILIFILIYFLLFCRIWNIVFWRSCFLVWRIWGFVWTRRSFFLVVFGLVFFLKRASSLSFCLR